MTAIDGEWRVKKTLFLSGLLVIGFVLASGPTLAQDGDDEEIEEITVTGSRIQRGNLTQPNPVYGLSAEDVLGVIETIGVLMKLRTL